jgi:hypothetical protein
MRGCDVVIAVLLMVVLVATGLLVAASLRLSSLVPSLLGWYLVVVAEVTGLTWALSPFRLVTRGGLAISEVALLVGALAVWVGRGRPGLPLGRVRLIWAELRGDWLVVGFLVCVVGALAYEFVLGLVVPPNNWDSLTYHLTRAIAWAHHGGIYWIPNAPTGQMNEFQPGAEQQLLYLFVATGKGALYAVPQFVAQLAILTAVYGAARRMAFNVRHAACAALFFATLSVVALEATTSMNDLVAASFPVAAVALLLGGAPTEIVLAGGAVALGLDVKLATALVLPVVALVAWVLGRERFALFAGSAGYAFAALGVWSFVLNLLKTGRLLGRGVGRVEDTASPSFPGSVATAVRVAHHLFDRSGYGPLTISCLTVGALVVAVVAPLAARIPALRRSHLAWSESAAVPLLAPLLSIGGAFVVEGVARGVHLPVNDPKTTVGHFSWHVNSAAHEDLSGFGPLGGLAVITVSAGTVIAGTVLALARRRGELGRYALGIGRFALGLALPLLIVLFSLGSKYNPDVSRFLIVPVALTAPLFALLFRLRPLAVSTAAVAVLSAALVLTHNELKPLVNTAYRPWQLTQVRAVRLNWGIGGAGTVKEINAAVPGRACLGAVIGADDPAFLLYGPRQRRDVVYLPNRDPLGLAKRDGLTFVVIGLAPRAQSIRADFRKDGWLVRRLPSLGGPRYWTLATRLGAHRTACTA